MKKIVYKKYKTINPLGGVSTIYRIVYDDIIIGRIFPREVFFPKRGTEKFFIAYVFKGVYNLLGFKTLEGVKKFVRTFYDKENYCWKPNTPFKPFPIPKFSELPYKVR